MIERDVVLQGRESGEETMDFPITKLSNVDGTAEVKERPEVEDFLPIVDSADGGQMKKAPLGAVMGRGFDLFKLKTVAFKISGTFTVPANAKDNKFIVICQGGGGTGALNGGAGGGGYTEIRELTLTPGASIAVTVGAGATYNSSAGPQTGGTSKFGSYVSAAGGHSADGINGGSGGSGGGGGSSTGNGGNGGTYGGGGGGKGTGGNGGTYGGGGGGKVNGKGGTHGGDGGMNAPAHSTQGKGGFYPFRFMGLVLTPRGACGHGLWSGGGGYFGDGGDGHATATNSGGGGGGYFGRGGNVGGTNGSWAGGGGGFNGRGGDGTEGINRSGGGGGLDIGDGMRAGNRTTADGCGYGAGSCSTTPGAPGIVLISWEEE